MVHLLSVTERMDVMSNNLMIFDGKDVEVFELNGQVLFNAKHVAEILDIKNINDNLRKMNHNQVVKVTNSNIGNTDFRKLHNTGENFLTESGVYKLVFKSRKPEAERFSDWVTDEVLPTIRKHGAYLTNEAIENTLTDPDYLIRLATALKEERQARVLAEKTIAEQKPLVEFANQVSNTTDLIDMKTMAKLLKNENINIGRNKLFDFLRIKEILMKDNQPYQQYINAGYFKVNEYVYTNSFGQTKINRQTFITGKGQLYIMKKVKEFWVA